MKSKLNCRHINIEFKDVTAVFSFKQQQQQQQQHQQHQQQLNK